MGNKNCVPELFGGKTDTASDANDRPRAPKDAETIASPSKQAMKSSAHPEPSSSAPAAAAQRTRKPSTPGALKRMEKREQRRAVTASLPEAWRLLEERQRAVIRRVAECERAAGYVGTNRAKKTAWDNARYQGLGGKNYLKGGSGAGRGERRSRTASSGRRRKTAARWSSGATKPSTTGRRRRRRMARW